MLRHDGGSSSFDATSSLLIRADDIELEQLLHDRVGPKLGLRPRDVDTTEYSYGDFVALLKSICSMTTWRLAREVMPLVPSARSESALTHLSFSAKPVDRRPPPRDLLDLAHRPDHGQLQL